jgi:protocatechuate 3,4-dioxygenase beta subunit
LPEKQLMKRVRSQSRREFLETAATGALGVGVVACAPARDLPPATGTPSDEPPRDCNPTPSNVLGPFHRDEAPERTELNPNGEEGERLVISGTVSGLDCPTALGTVDLDVWHCDGQGDYDIDTDAFAFRGRTQTTDGTYRLETLLPGRYLEGDEFRPRHIHFLVAADGYERLTTQLYFEDDEFNEVDRFYDPALAHALVPDGAGGWTVTFDIVLRDEA